MNTETFDAHAARVTAEVVDDLWGFAGDYACPLCNLPSVDGRPHLRCVRSAVQGTQTVAELARVLGVTANKSPPCPTCENTGVCPECGGSGRRPGNTPCPRCGGEGRCPDCGAAATPEVLADWEPEFTEPRT